MKCNKYKSALLWVIGLFSVPAVASSYYAWDYNGNCSEYTPRGFFIMSADSNRCRKTQGSLYNWDYNGRCVEYTPRGFAIAFVDSNRCRKTQGSLYNWDYNGRCVEYTPRGFAIRSVDLNQCRSSAESVNPTAVVREIITPSRHRESMHSELIGKRTRVDVKVEITKSAGQPSDYAAK